MPDELEWYLREAWRLIEASKARNRQARDEMRRSLKIIADARRAMNHARPDPLSRSIQPAHLSQHSSSCSS
jgi:hypothetical protein